MMGYHKNSWKYMAITQINQHLQNNPQGLTSIQLYHNIIEEAPQGRRLQRCLTPPKLTRLLMKEYPILGQTKNSHGNPRNIYGGLDD